MLKMINYIAEKDVINAIFNSELILELETDKQQKIYDVFCSCMQQATDRIHIYDALWHALLSQNIEVYNISDFYEAVYYILSCLPAHPVLDNDDFFVELWNMKEEKTINTIKPSSLEERIIYLEKELQILKQEIKPNYGGRM